MATDFRTGTWNVHDALSKEEFIEPVVAQIDSTNIDVAVLPEAYEEGHEEFLPEAEERFKGLGYLMTKVAYDDNDGRLDRHGLVMIDRRSGVPARTVRLGGRNALMIVYNDIKILGVHFDDRGEHRRMEQTEDAVFEWPEVIEGDMNSAANAFPLRLSRIATILPAHFPAPERPDISKPERLANIIHRVGDIASSEVASFLRNMGYRDAGELSPAGRRATWPSKRPVMAYDRIHGRRSRVALSGYKVHKQTGRHISDHRLVSTTVES